MPSGFIELSNFDIFSIKWRGYDEIIRITLRELETLKPKVKAGSLISHLQSHIPPPGFNERHEMGWGFIDERIHTTVCRKLEIHNLEEPQRELFWTAVEKAYSNIIHAGDKYSTMHPQFIRELLDLRARSVMRN